MRPDIELLTAEQILDIKHPYDLFGSMAFDKVLKKYSSIWHPDKNNHPLATQVMAHVNALADRAEAGDWGSILYFTEKELDKRYVFKFRKETPNDVGSTFIGKTTVMFQFKPENTDLFDTAVKAIQSIRFPTKMLEAGFNRFVPKELKVYRDTDKGPIFSVYKGPDQVSLADILEKGVELEPGHVVWILEGLYNFLLLMHQVQNKMFGGIDLDSVFINPVFKTVHVLGGWWFAETLGKELTALPNSILLQLPNKVITNKKATTAVDQLAIKLLAIKLLGDPTTVGAKLLKLDKKYQPMIQFLRRNPSDTTLSDYGEWIKVVKDLPRLDLHIRFNDIY